MKAQKITHCPICNGKKLVFTDSFWVCKSCGYETAGISDKELNDYYNQQDLGLKVQNILEEEGFESPLRNYHKKALRQMETYDGKKVCDVGCGVGVFLRRVKKEGGEVYGYDINKEQSVIAKKKYKLRNVEYAHSLQEYCKKLGIKKGFFDVITAFEVIEHIPDINQFVEEAACYLKKGGKLIISTPNRNRFYMHERWDYPPIHVSRITKKSIEKLMENHKLSVKLWTSYNEVGYYSNNFIHKLSFSQKMLSSVVNASGDKAATKRKLNFLTNLKKYSCIAADIPIYIGLLPFSSKGHTMFLVAQKL